jgi:hypothetical protein
MLMRLTFTACAALVLSACVITSGDTTDTLSDTSNLTTETGGTTVVDPTTGTGGTTAEDTTAGTTAGTTAEDTTAGTTGPETTTGPTTGVTTTDPETSGTTGIDMAGCGWYTRGKYYACFPDGEPGLEDPDMIDPIACADGLEEGAKCDDEMGPVDSIGCCDGDVLYFCDAGEVFRQECLGG